MTPQLDFIGIVVSDIAASVAFYRRLGLEFPPDAEQAGHVEATLPNGVRLALDTEAEVKSFLPEWTPPVGTSRLGVGFRCDDPTEVDAVYNDLVNAGYHGEKKPWDAPWGQRYATVHDPDGTGVDLYAVLSTSPA
ncbi:VOC family protein [Nocardia sp. CNY236]|uniref:VOC family protein n=1 Tax=Nocardia sp. CNY236 TaxID=1169152 RepID=UPI000404F260|nr:VOC family protein [Nocardia sp. CNY236]